MADDIGSFQPTQGRLLPLSHEVLTLADPVTGYPYAAILSDGSVIKAPPSRVGETIAIGTLHDVLPAPSEPTVKCLVMWDGAAPDRHGGFTKGEMLGDYATTGELYKIGGPGFKVQATGWGKQMRWLERKKLMMQTSIEGLIVANEG